MENCFIREPNNDFIIDNELTVLTESECENDAGVFGLLELKTCNVELIFPRIENLLNELQLLFGVGEVTAIKLKQAGYHSLADLLAHPRWGKAANELIRVIEAKDLVRLSRYGASDLQLLSFFKAEDIKFIDIETLGLYYIHPVFLIGVLQFVGGVGYIRQFIARDFSEEKAILLETCNELKNTEVIISFNGRSFDLPYLKGRMKFYNLGEEFDSLHFDLLRQIRRDYKNVLPNCRLLTLEKHLFNQERFNDIPGSEMALYYNQYLDTEDSSYIRPILEHNARDLLSMAKIVGLVYAKRSDMDGD